MKKSKAIAEIMYHQGEVIILFHSKAMWAYPCRPQEYATMHRVNSVGKYYNRVLKNRQGARQIFAKPIKIRANDKRSSMVVAFSRVFNNITHLV